MLRVFENRVLGKNCGPRRGEVRGEWRRLHNKEPYDPYFFDHICIIRVN